MGAAKTEETKQQEQRARERVRVYLANGLARGDLAQTLYEVSVRNGSPFVSQTSADAMLRRMLQGGGTNRAHLAHLHEALDRHTLGIDKPKVEKKSVIHTVVQSQPTPTWSDFIDQCLDALGTLQTLLEEK